MNAVRTAAVTGVAATLVCACAPAAESIAPPTAPLVTVDNGQPRVTGSRTITTISPNGDGFRDRAYVRIRVASPMVVRLEVRRGLPEPKTLEDRIVTLGTGLRTVAWSPSSDTSPDTYRLIVTARSTRITLLVRVEGVDAAFAHTSYRRGSTASLIIRTDAGTCRMRLFRVGSETARLRSARELRGVAVSPSLMLAPCGAAGRPKRHRVEIGPWPSGFYFARITAPDGREGFAPFVVRPRRIGEHRVAVVEPTFTWQAYNFRDENGDGIGDTWYANWSHHSTSLMRPYLDRGVPPHFRWYDLQFLHWLARHGHAVDFLTDEDLDGVRNGDELAAAYDLLVFPGHHEYVTTHEYDVVDRFRDRGRHLMFLSANNFFWRVDRHGSTLRRVAQWRDIGRPEAALVGVQYRGNDDGGRRGAYVLTDAPDWLVGGTGLSVGSSFGRYGIEIDQRAAATPPRTRLLARIPHLYGPGFDAEMTYYETPAGAKVFAAGAFTLAGTAQRPEVDALLTNLWRHLA